MEGELDEGSTHRSFKRHCSKVSKSLILIEQKLFIVGQYNSGYFPHPQHGISYSGCEVSSTVRFSISSKEYDGNDGVDGVDEMMIDEERVK